MSGPRFITPQWDTPSQVRAAFTLRQGGVSSAPFDSLNIGIHVGDDPAAIAENRRRIRDALSLPAEPCWLDQLHGIEVANLDDPALALTPRADAAFTREPGRVCAIQVADCLPVLFAAHDGRTIAAAHAGWRGLASGVLESTIDSMGVNPRQLSAWLGPAISQKHFEVGDEVRDAFITRNAGNSRAFLENAKGRWQCDLYALAHSVLTELNVGSICGGNFCTYSAADDYFSYRRDPRTGRMTALLWIER